MDEKYDPTIYFLLTYFRVKGTNRLSKCIEKKMYHTNSNQKKSVAAIVISDKIDFKTEIITRVKGHFIIIKVSIHHGDRTIINICAPYNRAPKYMKQREAELKGEIGNSTIIGNFRAQLSIINTTSLVINKEKT